MDFRDQTTASSLARGHLPPQMPPGTGKDAPLMGIGFFTIFGVLLPVYVLDPMTPISLNIVLAGGVCLVSAVRLAQLVSTGRPHLLTMGFYTYVYAALGLAAVAQVSTGQYPSRPIPFPDELVRESLIVILVGVLAFEVGTRLARPHRPGRPHKRVPTTDLFEFSHTRALAVGVVGMIFVLSTVAAVGVDTFFTSREGAAAALTGHADGFQVYTLPNKAGLLLRRVGTQFPTFLAFVALLSIHKNRQDRTDAVKYYSSLVALTALGIGNLMVNNPVSNSRFWFMIVLIGIACIYIPWQRPSGMRVLVWGAVTIMVFLFSSLDVYRRTGAQFRYGALKQTLVSDEAFGGLATIANGLDWVAHHGHTHGRQVLGSALVFVPSKLWPNKPIDTGHLIDPMYNRTATLWTEAHIEFGLISVIAVFLALGVLCRLGETWGVSSGGAVSIVMPMMAGFVIMLCRGSLQPTLGAFYPFAFFLTLLIVPTRRKRTPRRLDGGVPEPGADGGALS